MRRLRWALLSAQLRTSPNGSASSRLSPALRPRMDWANSVQVSSWSCARRQRHVVHMREAACLRHRRARHGGDKVGIERRARVHKVQHRPTGRDDGGQLQLVRPQWAGVPGRQQGGCAVGGLHRVGRDQAHGAHRGAQLVKALARLRPGWVLMTNWISPWQYKSTALLRWRPVCSKPKAVKVLASAWPVASSTPNSMKLKPPTGCAAGGVARSSRCRARVAAGRPRQMRPACGPSAGSCIRSLKTAASAWRPARCGGWAFRGTRR